MDGLSWDLRDFPTKNPIKTVIIILVGFPRETEVSISKAICPTKSRKEAFLILSIHPPKNIPSLMDFLIDLNLGALGGFPNPEV